jgi:hypothetical protein
MALSNVRVPADSNGKRLQHSVIVDVGFNNGVLPFALGEFVEASTSGIRGYVIKLTGTLTDGTIRLSLLDDSPEVFTIGENLVADGGFHATTTGAGTLVFTPAVTIAGRNDQTHGAHVNKAGSLQTGFAYGDPFVTSFGELKVAESYKLGTYKHSFDDNTDLFYDDTGTASSITWNNTGSFMLLSAGTSAAAKAIRTSHKRHYYAPGVSNKVIITIATGDTGKTNNIREWGVGDDENGLFWRLSGSTFGVVIRSKSTGVVTEQFIPQTDFNGDQIDGNGETGFNLQVNRRNLYFIDYAWLGVGPVRFGVLTDTGLGATCHIFNHSNGPAYAYTQDGTFPVRVANYNSGGVSDSTSELRFFCADFHAETTPQYRYETYANILNTGSVVVTTDTPVLSARAKLIHHEKVNYLSSYPDNLSLYVSGGNVRIDVCVSGTLSGANWNVAIADDAPLEGDVSATSITNKNVVLTKFVPPGVTNIDLSSIFNIQNYAVILNADKTTRNPFSVVATKLDGTTTTVMAALTYKEL